ncbi:MAG: hypothetical protein JSS07_05950 [Proteobacteria bacterium]|nr:hypothetical protein [Pseudomonadota bacterium]
MLDYDKLLREQIAKSEAMAEEEAEKTKTSFYENFREYQANKSKRDKVYEDLRRAGEESKQLQAEVKRNTAPLSLEQIIEQHKQNEKELNEKTDDFFKQARQENEALKDQWHKISQVDLNKFGLNTLPTEYLQPTKESQVPQDPKESRFQEPEAFQVPQAHQEDQQSKQSPLSFHRVIAFLRFALGIGVVGPLAGLGRYFLNSKSLIASALVVSTSLFVMPTASLAFILSAGFVVHAGVALYQTFKTNRVSNPKLMPSQASHFIQHHTFTGPIAKAMLFGFKTANIVAGRDNEPYGEKASNLCIKFECPKAKRSY